MTGKITNNIMMCHIGYFPMTAQPGVFYTSYTTTICKQSQFECINDQHVILFNSS